MKQIKPVYVYLDESGDLGKSGSRFFIVAMLSNQEPNELERVIKRLRHRKLKKTMKSLSELKGNNSSKVIREYLLKQLMKTNSEIHIIAVNKQKVRDDLFDVKSKLYNYITGILVERSEIYADYLNLIVDMRDSRNLIQDDFNNYVTKKFKEKLPMIHIAISHKNSMEEPGLQVVDFVAWAANRKYSFGEDAYYKIIEPKIKTFKQLF